MLKKLIALLLAMVVCASMLAGCGNPSSDNKTTAANKTTNAPGTESGETEESTEDPKVVTFPLKETANITMAAVQPNADYPLTTNVAWLEMEKRTNVHMELTSYDSAEYKEKLNLLLNGGTYPEVIYSPQVIDANKYGEDGVFIPLNDLIRQYMPNLCAILDERQAWAKLTTGANGEIYTLPQITQDTYKADTSNCIWINDTWLQAVGKTMPTNRDEFYEVLKAFKTQDPNGNGQQDEIPWIAYSGHWDRLLATFSEVQYYGSNWAVMDGEKVFLPSTEYFKDYLKFLKKLYDEELVSIDLLFTGSAEQAKGIAKSGDNVGVYYAGSPSFSEADTKGYLDWKILKPFNVENSIRTQGVNRGALAITDKCTNPELVCQWADYLYSDEGSLLYALGVEGVSYEINADGTYKRIGEFGNRSAQAAFVGVTAAPGLYPLYYYTGLDATVESNVGNAHVYKERYEEGYGAFTVGPYAPMVTMNAEEKEATDTIATDVKGYVDSYVADVVTGLKDIDSTWDEFQQTLKRMGIDDLVAAKRAAYERGLEQMK